MRAPRSFTLPRRRTWSPRWVGISIAAHAVLLLVVAAVNAPRPPSLEVRPLLYLLPSPAAPRSSAEVAVPLPRDVRRGGSEPLVFGRGIARRSDSATVSVGPGSPDSGIGQSMIGRRRLGEIGPRLGGGQLWVGPLAMLEGESRPIRLDSVVQARMRAMADSIDRNPSPDPNRNPYVSRPWIFERGGKTYGIDARGLHLGDFTIPTAALAFLALPQGNVDQAMANQRLMAMRAEILRAAARAQAEDDFRRAVREIRERKGRERQEQRERERERPRPVP